MTSVRIVLQARTDSARLPGKSLRKLGKLPLVVLVGARASTSGYEVVLATSDQRVDDKLAEFAMSGGLRVVRGSLHNVRERIVNCVADLEDDAVLVRLTADNPVPDGDLIRKVVEEYMHLHVDHLETNGANRTLPFGVSVEVMSVGALRRSLAWSNSLEDQEHVTTALRRFGISRESGITLGGAKFRDLRCTIDTPEDFEVMESVFSTLVDPIRARWHEIVERVAMVVRTGAQKSDLQLMTGTAQLRLPYGSVCRTEPPPEQEAQLIVKTSVINGLWIDTSSAYGDAEKVIGTALGEFSADSYRVVTKVGVSESHLGSLVDATHSVRTTVQNSLSKMGSPARSVVLLHDPNQINACDGAVWRELMSMRQSGQVEKIGVSVDSPETLLRSLDLEDIQVVQLPLNLLDRRWESERVVSALSAMPNIEVHCRSIFLQGVLLQNENGWPRFSGLDRAAMVRFVSDSIELAGLSSPRELCFSWIKGPHPLRNFISAVVVGAETLPQLKSNIEDFRCRPLTDGEMRLMSEMRPSIPGRLLNPAQWN